MKDESSPEMPRKYDTQYGDFHAEPVIGFYDILSHGKLPFASYTTKVVIRITGEYVATANVMVYNSSTKCIEHTCGIGKSLEEALTNSFVMFMSEVEKQRSNKSNGELDETDFVWLNWQPYVQLWMPTTN